MIEHPVPQNITAYQFHLVGNMTVKQFLMLLGGAGIAFLFYTTNLPNLLKWSFIIFFFAGSAAAAFVPYEDRTLDQWIVNFIRAIYRPTKYYWRRHPQIPSFLSYQPRTNLDTTPNPASWAPQKRQKVQAYLSSLQSDQGAEATDPLDIFTRKQADVNSLFTSVAAAANVKPGATDKEQAQRPTLTVRARPLHQPEAVYDAGSPGAVMAAQARLANASHQPGHTVSTVHQAKPAPQPPKETTSITPNQVHLSRAPQTVQVAKVDTEGPAPDTTTVAAPTAAPAAEQSYVNADQLASSSLSGSDIVPAVFDRNLPFPSLPTQPNVLVGMVHDAQQKIVPSAIIEILDEKGNTVRAMKTNTLGQFYISSALKPGSYRIETEKDDLTFPVYALNVTNTVLDPINITAQ